MEKNSIKCSNEKHNGINAISFCKYCNEFLCYSCCKSHSTTYKNHNLTPLNEIQTNIEKDTSEFCQEKNHQQMTLEYYCNTHKTLVCALCICKLNNNNYGTHNNCEVYPINKVEMHKKEKLEKNINVLDSLIKDINEVINLEPIKSLNEIRESLKLQINSIFDEMKKSLEIREKELIEGVDKKFEDNLGKEELKEIANNLTEMMNNAKKMISNWDETGNLITKKIQKCIYIENQIKSITKILKNYKKINRDDFKIKFQPEIDEPNSLLSSIKDFGNIISSDDFKFRECPKDIDYNKIYKCNNNVVTKTSKNAWQVITTEKALPSKSCISWTIKILKSTNYLIMVGVCPKNLDLNTTNPYNISGWYLELDNGCLYSGPPHNYSTKETEFSINKSYKENIREIKVIIDTKEGNLSFIINNNKNYVPCYTNIPCNINLVPAVVLFNNGDSVAILP